MTIQEIDLIDGSVLRKISRNEQPVSLTLIEKGDSRSTYCLNSEVALYVKHSATPTISQPSLSGWKFTFSPKQLLDLSKLFENNSVYVALVGVDQQFKNRQVALLEPHHIWQLLNLDNPTKAQTIFVDAAAGRKLRVYRNRKERPILISRGRLNSWSVPGR